MQRYEANIISLVGPPLIGVTPVPGVGLTVDGFTATVLTFPGLAAASIFSDNAASPTIKANPFPVGSDGRFFFYARNGRYQVSLLKAGILSASFVDVLISDNRRTFAIGTPAAVGANLFTEHTVAGITGLVVGDFVAVTKPTFQSGVAAVSARVSAADTLGITFHGSAAGATPTAGETYILCHIPA